MGFKRKQVWVDSPLQVQMMGYVLVLVTASLLLLTFSAKMGLEEAAKDTRQLFFSLDWVHEAVRGPMIIAATLSILASGVVTLLWSHRFAGPLRVLSAAMGRLREGDFSVGVRIRDTDTHQDLVKEFAQMQGELRLRIERDNEKVHDLAKKLEHVAEKLSKEHHAHKDLESAVAALKKIGADYKL
jgi:nitrogen fixation/metabolism regulation signal transduction histidine kinase